MCIEYPIREHDHLPVVSVTIDGPFHLWVGIVAKLDLHLDVYVGLQGRKKCQELVTVGVSQAAYDKLENVIYM